MLQNKSPHFDEENRAAQFASDKTLIYRLDVCQECSVQVQSRDLWPVLKVNRVMYVRFLNRSQTDINCSAVVIDPRLLQLFLSGSRGNDILFSLL